MSADMRGILNLNPSDETELTFDYNISRQEIQHIIRDKQIKKMSDLIKILEKRKMETKQQLERDEKDKQKENKRILKEAQQQRATDLIRQYNGDGLPSDVPRNTEWQKEYELLRYKPDEKEGSYRIGGKKKRTKRNKRRSYRKNRRTNRNVYKKKNKKNKNPKNN